MNNLTKSDYPNIVIAGLKKNRNGSFSSYSLDQQGLDKISKAVEVGGKFYIRERTSASITAAQNKARDEGRDAKYVVEAYLEFVPKAEVDRYFEEMKKNDGPKGF